MHVCVFCEFIRSFHQKQCESAIIIFENLWLLLQIVYMLRASILLHKGTPKPKQLWYWRNEFTNVIWKISGLPCCTYFFKTKPFLYRVWSNNCCGTLIVIKTNEMANDRWAILLTNWLICCQRCMDSCIVNVTRS